jgi:TetR/AcrR family transcriptional regulator
VSVRDPEATKERILAAALHEFSAKGISGARVDAIAARAKVNKRMLYYYFGSKDDLFREILRRRLAERSEPTSLTPLRTRQERLARDGEYVRLLMWEALQTQSSRPANEALRREFFRTWIETVEAEQAAGRLPDDLDPAQLVLSELFLVIGPVALPQLTRLVTGKSPDDPEFLADRLEFLDRLERRLSSSAAVRD